MTAKWDGITKSEVLGDNETAIRHNLADAAKAYNWNKTLEILNKRPDLINVTRPDGRSLYTPVHQAALCLLQHRYHRLLLFFWWIAIFPQQGQT